ncbi:glycosyltransferase 87 family protein [Oscillatoria sp. CS-180]|uniref:glycosyltransferase 87 family protein n=1 Tax=Oscillatoria sp. CS-180 TaxID=3021720 RepID=UPI00232D5349|nr:glycosyltransferase 87 family protein [Oscillatoria sp. CS-180]MDB9529345.1 glycosyltransferase 87 family protein [Oscillatoria sp. CS-180]
MVLADTSMEPVHPPSTSPAPLTSPKSVLAVIWRRYGQLILQVGIGLMIAAALWRLGLELPRLIWGEDRVDAVDLISRHREVEYWFSRQPVYGALPNGDYPPASHVLLWPLLSWMDREAARWFWAGSTLAVLAWLSGLGIRESRATTLWEKLFIALLPFALYPASAGIRVGQLATHVIPPLVAGLLLIDRSRRSWSQDILGAAFVIFALVKPTVSAPFFWLVCFMPGRWRPVVLVSGGYAIAALIATGYQAGNLLTLHADWLAHAGDQLGTRGHASVHTWLEAAGLSEWMLPASLLLMGAMGLWTWLYRRADPWTLMSVAALISRFWTDHQVFDDLLLWIPVIALFRLAKTSPSQPLRLITAILFALNWFALMAPARFLNGAPPISTLAVGGQTILWVGLLVFFMVLAQQELNPPELTHQEKA